MIKRTDKIAANKVMIAEVENELVLKTYDKDGFEIPDGDIKIKDFLRDFINKQYISITVGYDEQM